MTKKTYDVFCLHCEEGFSGPVGTSFFGFRTFDCPHCKKTSTYPLFLKYRMIYLALLVFMVIAFIGIVSKGWFAYPGLFGLAVIYVVIKDMVVKGRVDSIFSIKKPAEPSKVD